MSGRSKEVLLVGFGAVGAICEQLPKVSKREELIRISDSLIFKRSGIARVTAVARSNYDVVKSRSLLVMIIDNQLIVG